MFFSKIQQLISKKNKEIIFELQYHESPLTPEKINNIKKSLDLKDNDVYFTENELLLKNMFFDITIRPIVNYNLVHYNFYDKDKKNCLKIQSDFDIINFLDYEKNCQVVFNLADKVACINMDASNIPTESNEKIYEALKYILKFCYDENVKETFELIAIKFDFFPKEDEKEILINFINKLKEIDSKINTNPLKIKQKL